MKYWQRFAARRVSRLQAMAASSAAAASAAFLIACGGDGDDNKQAKSGSGLLATPQDSSTGAKAGGVLKFLGAADIDHFDATISATSQTVALPSEPFYPHAGPRDGEVPEGTRRRLQGRAGRKVGG